MLICDAHLFVCTDRDYDNTYMQRFDRRACAQHVKAPETRQMMAARTAATK
jgi:hypothetical protein